MNNLNNKTVLTAPDAVAITFISPDKLKPFERNSRQHSDKQIKQIAASILQFGFNSPVVVDGNNRIIAGHGRVLAAQELKLPEVPTIKIQHLSEDQIRAYVIADNKLGLNSSWDKEKLIAEIDYLSSLDINFDVEITGFNSLEIDSILQKEIIPDAEDVAPDVDLKNLATCKVGELWQLGNHRLICGDARETGVYESLLADARVDMIFTDPPYNIKIDGNVCGNGRIKHKEFAMASGEMSENEFIAFINAFLVHLKHFSRDGSLHYICMDWRHLFELQTAARAIYSELKSICVWNKDNGGMGSFYRSKHEMVLVYKNGDGKAVNNIELGKHGRYRTNVWDYPGVNTMRKDRLKDLAMHPTVKPVIMVADAIKDCTRRGNSVLDPFAGSGTTIIAAEKTKRIAYAIELDPHYCDVILKRWHEFAGTEAVHAATGRGFSEIKTERDGGDHE